MLHPPPRNQFDLYLYQPCTPFFGQDDAIASGHGAYLMEEKDDEPNVFTVNVGNLPPQKTVDISLTYVTELHYEKGLVHTLHITLSLSGISLELTFYLLPSCCKI